MLLTIQPENSYHSAFQYSFFKEAGAFTIEDGKHRLDFDKLEQAITDLVRTVVMVQGDGDYEQAKAFLDQYAVLDDVAQNAISSLTHLPVDIQPVYADEL